MPGRPFPPSLHRLPRLRGIAAGWLCAGLLWPGPCALAGELGAFFAPGPLAAYEQGPRQGGRLALRPRTAYAVIGLAWEEGGDRLWLKLSVPEQQRTLRSEGWTPLTAEELAARGTAPIEVYKRPAEAGGAAESVQVPGADVQLLPPAGAAGPSGPAAGSAAGSPAGNTASQAFPPLVWRPVRYTLRRAAQPWVAEAQGIYRPGRSPAFLMAAYLDMTGMRIPAENLRRLLTGVVRPGDSAQDVRWAWGEPLRTWSEGAEGRRTAVWEFVEGQLRFEGATVREVR